MLDMLISPPIPSSYFHDHMEGILIAISEGVDVRGCLAWSLVDNLEWTSGYYKASFFEYAGMFKTYQES